MSIKIPFSIASTQESSLNYASFEYENIIFTLEALGCKMIPDSHNRIYMANSIFYNHKDFAYISSYDPKANNILYLTSCGSNINTDFVKMFKKVLVPTEQVRIHLLATYPELAWRAQDFLVMSPIAIQIPSRQLPEKKKRMDILYIGDLNRSEIVEDILPFVKKSNMEFKIAGNFWDYYNGSKEATQYWMPGYPLEYHAIPELVAAARVVLYNQSAVMSKVGGITSQYIDLIKDKGCVIAKENPFISSIGGITYKDPENLWALVDLYVNNVELRKKNTKAMHKVSLDFCPITSCKLIKSLFETC